MHLTILLFVFSISGQVIKCKMKRGWCQHFCFIHLHELFFFLIPKMSSSVSKGSSHRNFNVIVIEVNGGGRINDKNPVDGTYLISICTKLLVIKSIVKCSTTCLNSSRSCLLNKCLWVFWYFFTFPHSVRLVI